MNEFEVETTVGDVEISLPDGVDITDKNSAAKLGDEICNGIIQKVIENEGW